MVYDLNMLKSFYASYKGKMEHVRAALKRPLTLAEKILYTHLYNVADLKNYERGEDYVNFRPDRVAMHGPDGRVMKIVRQERIKCLHLNLQKLSKNWRPM